MSTEKNVLLLGDLHCGHNVGLTPPEWIGENATNVTTKRNKWVNIRRELWDSFIDILKEIPKPDVVIVNGDMIDGKGKRSGGTELITSDMRTQCDMAVSVLQTVEKYSKKNVQFIGTYGTPYHTSPDGDDWEKDIACRVGFKNIGAHEWIDVNGLVFDVKHHIGSSGVPYGRHSAISKEAIWNELWALYKMQPRADVFIRSHVHYFQHCGTADRLCMTLPALQGMGSKYGAKQCSGLVDWGCVSFTVRSKTDYDWHPYLRRIESQKAKVVKV